MVKKHLDKMGGNQFVDLDKFSGIAQLRVRKTDPKRAPRFEKILIDSFLN